MRQITPFRGLQTYLEVVNSVDAVDGGDAAELECQQDVLVVLAGVLQVLPNQHEVWFEGSAKEKKEGRLNVCLLMRKSAGS